MITKNLIVNQLPEFINSNSKPIRGLATISEGSSMQGNIKVFNIPNDLLPLILVVKVGEQKFTFANITTPENFDFKLSGGKAGSDITLLLATSINNSVTGLAMAHNSNASCDLLDLFSQIPEQELDTLIDEELNKEFETEIEEDTPDTIKAAPEEIINLSLKPEEKEELLPPQDNDVLLDIEPTGNFYALIQPQLNELFARFPHFHEMEELVANTQWVKVNFSPDDPNHYILGKLFEDQVVTHLCYGIPAESPSITPPASLIEFCQWLPLNPDDPEGAGYWVMYQSAETGENIKL